MERRIHANPAAPPLQSLLFQALPPFPTRRFWQVTHVPAARRNSKSRAAEPSPHFNDMCKHVLSNLGNSVTSHVGCAKAPSKKFHFVSHERPVRSRKAGGGDMLMPLMLSLLQTKLMIFKPWSHQIPVPQGLVLGEHQVLSTTWEFHTPEIKKMRVKHGGKLREDTRERP